MYKIEEHPILEVPQAEQVSFTFNGQIVTGEKGFTIAAALHHSGFPVHSHSLKDRNRSLECGIGKCGRCNVGKHFVCKDGPVFTFAQLREMPQEY